MKKFILMMMVLFGTVCTINAQTAYEKAKFFDNWSAGVTAGISSPLDFDHVTPFNTNFGIKLQKDFTPEVGLQIEGLAFVNDNGFNQLYIGSIDGIPDYIPNTGNTWVKASNVGVNGILNWTNIFCGYKKAPRFFEVNTVTGIGWLHTYGVTHNYLSAKTGFDLAFNLGKSKAHSIVLTPAVYWNLGALDNQIQFDKSHAQLAVNVSYVYHFKTSNGTHSFKKYNVGAMKKEINHLKKELAKKPKEIIHETVKTETIVNSVDNSYTVNFTKGSSKVSDVTAIANALKNSDSKITVIGGVSPEGTEAFNKKLALDRAQAVKGALVKAGISADRISVTSDYASQRRATIVVEK